MEQPSKRQRVYRKRIESDEEERREGPDQGQVGGLKLAAESNDTDDEQAELGIVKRKLQKRIRPGLAFSKDSSTRTQREAHVDDAVDDGQTPRALNIVADGGRFTRETGQQVDDGTDKHMMAYIDSKLAQRSRDEEGASQPNYPTVTSSTAKTTHDHKSTGSGKLQEIDLGPSATQINVQRTEQARHRLEGGDLEEAEPPKPQRIRLGRDGKPVKPRKRFRRRSEDVERDKLIDSLMREARLEVYERPDELPISTGNDEAADERIAEEFRRDFLNQVEDRNMRRGPPPPPGPSRGSKGEPDVTKGPKLGGSRSARAAMRAQQEAAKRH